MKQRTNSPESLELQNIKWLSKLRKIGLMGENVDQQIDDIARLHREILMLKTPEREIVLLALSKAIEVLENKNLPKWASIPLTLELGEPVRHRPTQINLHKKAKENLRAAEEAKKRLESERSVVEARLFSLKNALPSKERRALMVRQMVITVKISEAREDIKNWKELIRRGEIEQEKENRRWFAENLARHYPHDDPKVRNQKALEWMRLHPEAELSKTDLLF